MGRYFEEYYRYDLPRHYLQSRERRHTFNRQGRHDDQCLKKDVALRLADINDIQHIDTSGLVVEVKDGIAYASGFLNSLEALTYVKAALDGVDGIMNVRDSVQIAVMHRHPGLISTFQRGE